MKHSVPGALLVVTVLTVLFLVLFTNLFLYPQIRSTIDRILIEETHNNAEIFAGHLASLEEPLAASQLPTSFREHVENYLDKFNSHKVRLFSPAGEIIFSSDSGEVGRVNDHPYFHKIVARGKSHSSLVEKKHLSAEGDRMSSDVVETYIPIMRGKSFLGAVEIYNDVSLQKNRLERLVDISSRIILVATTLLLLILALLLWRSRQNQKASTLLQEAKLLEESERKYRDIFENAMDSIFILDDQCRYVDANPMATEVFGYSHKEFLAMSVFDVIPADQRPRSQAEFERLKDRGSYKNFTGRMRTRDGRWRDVEVNSSVIRKDGRVIGSRDLVRDITERKKLEEELARMRNLDSLGILAGGIAHDFNNLLTAILGNISLVRTLPADNPRKDSFLNVAENAVMRAKDLTQQLLTFSQGGTRQRQLVDLAELIRSGASIPLTGTRIRCDFELESDLRPIEADPGQISQVVQNLVQNAREAMPDNGQLVIKAENITLGAEEEQTLKAGNYVRLTFTDNGVGINAEALPRIFDPYFSSKTPDTRKGMGLGLAICHSIIESHQGRIEVKSQPQQGTTFTILLPAEKRRHEKAEEFSQISPTPNKLNPRKILVLDDEEAILEVAKELLQLDGHSVTCVTDGKDAVESYRRALEAEAPFDLVILDLTVPGGMGGIETLEELKALDPEVVAVVSSGYHYGQYGTGVVTDDFQDSLDKPYSIKNIRQVLARLFAGK